MKINIAIVEDNLENIETLKHLLEEIDIPAAFIGSAGNPEDAEALLKREDIDLAFLDIQLRDGDIFQVLENVIDSNKIKYDIVFVTAHSSFEYATKAIQYACLDYITKPIDKQQLEEVLFKVKEKKHESKSQIQVEHLIKVLKNNISEPDSISVSLPKGIIEIVALEDIISLQADANTCIFNISDGSLLHSVKPFSHFLNLMESHPSFVQISRNTLLNKKHIKRYDHRNKSVALRNGHTLVVSHRFSSRLKSSLTGGISGGFWNEIRNLFSGK